MADKPTTVIERAEDKRDLRDQLGAIETADEQQIIFKETSPKRKKTVIYRMRDGQPCSVPEYMAIKALDQRDPETGGYMFTAKQETAPSYQRGSVLCFLHADSPDQQYLQALGLTQPCRKATLMNPHSKRMHALHRHPQEWAAYQEFLTDQEKREDRERQQQQLDATLALAGRAIQAPPVAAPDLVSCPSCDYTGTQAQINGHKSVHNKAEAAPATS